MENNSIEFFEDILNELFEIPFSQTNKIKEYEQKIYQNLQKSPGNIYGLITLLFVQFMQGYREDSKKTAYRIWEIGGSLPQLFEIVYIEVLLGLGLLDKATILLKPKFENLRENIDYFYPVLSKFAIITGSVSLLERMSSFPQIKENDSILFDFAEMYRAADCISQFKDLQKMVMENVGNMTCAYEYDLYDDREFPELEVVIYVTSDDASCLKIEAELSKKIDAYWLSCGKERLYNYGVSVRNIRHHDSWIEEDTED